MFDREVGISSNIHLCTDRAIRTYMFTPGSLLRKDLTNPNLALGPQRRRSLMRRTEAPDTTGSRVWTEIWTPLFAGLLVLAYGTAIAALARAQWVAEIDTRFSEWGSPAARFLWTVGLFWMVGLFVLLLSLSPCCCGGAGVVPILAKSSFVQRGLLAAASNVAYIGVAFGLLGLSSSSPTTWFFVGAMFFALCNLTVSSLWFHWDGQPLFSPIHRFDVSSMSLVCVVVAAASIRRWQRQMESLFKGTPWKEEPSDDEDVFHRGFAGFTLLLVCTLLCGAFFLDNVKNPYSLWPTNNLERRSFPHWDGTHWLAASATTTAVALIPCRIMEYHHYSDTQGSVLVVGIGEMLGTIGVFASAIVLISTRGLPSTTNVRRAKQENEALVEISHQTLAYMESQHQIYDSATGAFHVLTAIALGLVFRIATTPIQPLSQQELQTEGIAGVVAFGIAVLLTIQNYTILVQPVAAVLTHILGAGLLLTLPAWSVMSSEGQHATRL